MGKSVELSDVLGKYGVPDPKIVGKLPRKTKQGSTIHLDFVGHADVTKMLIEIDENWTWEPTAFDDQGLPAYRVENGMAHMAGWLTLHGVRRLGIGSVEAGKPDLLKELCSDFIRNAAMRFGVCLALWTKQEWDDVSVAEAPKPPVKKAMQPVQAAPKQAETNVYKQESVLVSPEEPAVISHEQRRQLIEACAKDGIAVQRMAELANVDWDEDIFHSDLPALRQAFKQLKAEKGAK